MIHSLTGLLQDRFSRRYVYARLGLQNKGTYQPGPSKRKNKLTRLLQNFHTMCVFVCLYRWVAVSVSRAAQKGAWGPWSPTFFQKAKFFVCRIYTLNPKADVAFAWCPPPPLSKSMRGTCVCVCRWLLYSTDFQKTNFKLARKRVHFLTNKFI